MIRSAGTVAFALGLLLSSAPLFSAQSDTTAGYCALEVAVKSPSGEPTPGVSVSASARGGKPFATVQTDKQGLAGICDIPTAVTLTIRIRRDSNPCGEVTIGGLYRLWLKTRRVNVTYEECNPQELYFPGFCGMVLRVRDERDVPLAGVKLVAVDANHQGEKKTVSDKLGRIFLQIPTHQKLKSELSRNGYEAQSIILECNPRAPFEQEQTIILKRRQ
jgi:hypothetical protein